MPPRTPRVDDLDPCRLSAMPPRTPAPPVPPRPDPTPPGAIVVCQMEVVPGNPEANLARILRGIDDAAAAGASLVLFPEMALPVYLVGDEWENDAFLRDLAGMNDEIVAHTRGIGRAHV